MPHVRKTTDVWTLSLKPPGRGWGPRVEFASREEMEPIIEAIRKSNHHQHLKKRTLMHVKKYRGGAGGGRPFGAKDRSPRKKRA